MDKLAQTALSAIRQMQDLKYDLAHNLANVNVPGFRQDLPNEGNAGFFANTRRGHGKRFCRLKQTHLFSSEMGRLENTGLETDVAVLNEGIFISSLRMGRLHYLGAEIFQ